MKKFLLILTIPFLFANGFAMAAAVKVNPSEIKAEVESGSLSKQEILIENPDNNVAFYEVYADNFSDWIKIKPESFVLESGDSQKVVLEMKNNEVGIFSTTLSVIAKPLSERQFKANSGVKIPLEIRIVKNKEPYFLADISQVLESPLGLVIIIYIFSSLLILTSIGVRMLKRNLKKKV